MITVLVVDHSFLHQINWIEEFLRVATECKIVLVTDKRPSQTNGRLQIVNVNDVPEIVSLEVLQRRLGFSIYKALVPERAYFDYTSLQSSQRYSNLTLPDIGELIGAYVSALDYVIRTQADVVLGHLADNGIASIAAALAKQYDKPLVVALPLYWWANGFIITDRPDQTSSQVDALYHDYYSGKLPIDRKEIAEVFSRKQTSLQFSDNVTYRLSERLKKIVSSMNWHDPFSVKNWIIRRVRYVFSQVGESFLSLKRAKAKLDKPFLLFPLHVVPEASLLGAAPELADQISLIKNLSINLPWGVELLVKKHPGQKKWFGPGYSFFRQISAMPNVKVADTAMSADTLLAHPNCLAVAAINGTIGLEAAMKRKPVFVFGPAIYGVARCFIKPQSFSDFERRIVQVLQGNFEFDDQALFAILSAMDRAVWRTEVDFAKEKTSRQYAYSTAAVYDRYIRARPWEASSTAEVREDGYVPRSH